jgi:3-oxoacyl-[acyl-carrier protein] reductase
MDQLLSDKMFIVTGASSGLGNAVARGLLAEGACIIAVARRMELLGKLKQDYPAQVRIVNGDITEEKTIENIIDTVEGNWLAGVFLNAGGPPAKSIDETSLEDWDEAYRLLVRWKVRLVKALLPLFTRQQEGRILFSESSSLRQPVENLVLSNSLRLAIAGFAKTLSMEYAGKGITVNVIGPGYHDTEAVKRLFRKKSEQEHISFEEARIRSIHKIPAGHLGNPDDFASLAIWLLSPKSGFVTGQVFFIDGGAIKSTL